jgi:hypothetical protein
MTMYVRETEKEFANIVKKWYTVHFSGIKRQTCTIQPNFREKTRLG